jgi:alpha-mannosidase
LKPKSNTNGDLAQEMSFFTVSDPMVRISTIKKSEKNNDVILRLVEMEGKDKEPTVELAVPFKQLVKTNLIEEEESKLPSTGKEFKVNIGHNAIDTYKLIFSE